MRRRLCALTVLTLASLTLAGAGPVVSQTPTLEQALWQAHEHTPLPLSLAQDQADWLVSHAALPDEVDPTEDVEDRIVFLLTQADRNARLAGTIFPERPTLGRACVVTALKSCSSSIGGYLALEGGSLQWQIQDGFTEEAGVSGGVVFLADPGPARVGPVSPIAWSFDAARFDAPILLAGPAFGGQVYIAVPGVRAGSGSGNADLLFRWNPSDRGRLSQIDTWSWRDDLPAQLPAGLSVLQGVRYDWTNMLAVTPLWREGDGHCCGTGGMALLSFAIEGDRLALSDVRVR